MATANPSALLGAGLEFTTKLGMHAVTEKETIFAIGFMLKTTTEVFGKS